MLVQPVLVCITWLLSALVITGDSHAVHSRRPKRSPSINSQSVVKSNTDENSSQNDPNSGLHNILPNYRTPAKYCYQCAYSPPRSYSSKEKQSSSSKAGSDSLKTAGGGTVAGRFTASHSNNALRNGGWDKCLGPFDELQASEYGVDVWQCHSNCYTRRDPNGDIFRGCFKGEYGVDPSLDGCHHQSGSIYCFCDLDRCNNGAAPPYNGPSNH